MKRKNILLLAAVAVLIIVFLYGFTGSQDNSSYIEDLMEERKEKDNFMRSGNGSPLKAEEKKGFKGLTYFEPDLQYRILANFTPVENRKMVLMNTSDGKTERYMEYGYAEFDLHDKKNRLLIYEMIDMGPARGKLFLPFGDETSARETYGAGRYLDLNKVPGGTTITLDFNRAYNPYCAYNETFSCPLPPQENLLSIPIRAGEKNYK